MTAPGPQHGGAPPGATAGAGATGRASGGRAAGVGAVLAVLALAPLVRPGYALLRDMVFVPRQPFLPEQLGIGPALPRAVPVDAVVSALSLAVPGWLLQRVVLAGVFVVAAAGAALLARRALPGRPAPVPVVAAVAYAWNPYLAQRLLLGDVWLLAGYALLPWTALAALRVRDGRARGWPAVAVALGLAALTPTGGVLAALLALVLLAWPGAATPAWWRRVGGVAALAVVANGPWWVPGAMAPGGAGSDAAGVPAFASRADTPLGTLGSLVGLGGVWNAQADPPGRTALLAVLGVLVYAGLSVVGWSSVRRGLGRPAGTALAAAGLLGLALAMLGAVGPTAALLGWAVVHVPGAGLLRDGQKWVALLAVAEAVGVAAGAAAVAEWVCGARARRAGAVLAVAAVLPVALLPGLAFGAFGRLSPVRYPAAFASAAAAVATDGSPGTVVVLPWSAYRQFAWNGRRPQLDPLPRWLDRSAVVDGTLVVPGAVVSGEDPRAAAVAPLVGPQAPSGPAAGGLRAAGVGLVAVEHGTPGRVDPAWLVGLEPVVSGGDVEIYRVPAGTGRSWPQPPAAPVLAADAAALGVAVTAGIVAVRPRAAGRLVGSQRRRRGRQRAWADWLH